MASTAFATDSAESVAPLFTPFTLGSMTVKNRIAMAPMTRCFSPGGVPGADVAAYYRKRAENGVGLIITEGTWIPHAGASNEENAPRFYGDDALAGWQHVAAEVHAAGGKIVPQLWHVGQTIKPKLENVYDEEGTLEPRMVGPSGMAAGIGTMPEKLGTPMTQADIDAVIEAYATAAQSAMELGFDGVELHGAHGYLIDQFLWKVTNLRTDGYGGSIAARSRFAAEVVAEIRRRTRPDFPIILRLSQWKLANYDAKLADTPQELEQILDPLAEAGVDMFHASQRRFWETEFGTDLNLAGWIKKLSGKPTMSVGSVSLDADMTATFFSGAGAKPASLDRLMAMFNRGDFDMVAIGRALISDPAWADKVRTGRFEDLLPFVAADLGTLA